MFAVVVVVVVDDVVVVVVCCFFFDFSSNAVAVAVRLFVCLFFCLPSSSAPLSRGYCTSCNPSVHTNPGSIIEWTSRALQAKTFPVRAAKFTAQSKT